MTLRPFFEWMDALESSIALRESFNAYPALLTAHVISMALFAGLIAYWDLRLLGLTLKKVRVSSILPRLLPWALTGFAISTITGLLLFYSQPMRYYGNFYFWFKNALLLLAGVNVFVFHVATQKTVAAWDLDETPPLAARMAGVVSLVLFASIVTTGRLIAYAGLAPVWWDNLNINR